MVDDDACHDLRAALGGGVGVGGAPVDLGEGVEAALSGGAGQVLDGGCVAMVDAGLLPVGEGLGVEEMPEDRLQLRALQ